MDFFSIPRAYAVAGNENPPAEIIRQIEEIAPMLEKMGWTLRTGGGKGTEASFEKHVEKKEVYLPWKKFNAHYSKNTRNLPEAENIIKRIMPNYDDLKQGVKPIFCRNAHTILGKDLSNPVKFLIAWTDDGCETKEKVGRSTGFSGIAISLACAMKLPIFNLRNATARERLEDYLRQNS